MAKKKFNVYLRQCVFDYAEDPNCFIHRERYIGTTYAASKVQAENNVRFRNGDKYSYYADNQQEIHYHAIPADDDSPDKHDGYTNFCY